MYPVFGWTPFLAIDIETTSRSTRHGEIVEIAAWRIADDTPPRRVFDSLVKPYGPIAATDRHGIDPAQVEDAPRINALVPRIESALANRILVAHNAPPILRHLEEAFRRAGRPWTTPRHICTMQFARALDLPGQLTLSQACQHLGVPVPTPPHQADQDAAATARLFSALRAHAGRLGVMDLEDLAGRARFFKLADSFIAGLHQPLWPAPPRLDAQAVVDLKPRVEHRTRPRTPKAQYHTAVIEALASLDVADVSISYLEALRRELGIDAADAAHIHAQVLAAVERRYREDHTLDDTEASHLARLRHAIARIEAISVPSRSP